MGRPRSAACWPSEVKDGHFPALSIDELCYIRDEAAEFCQLVKRRLGSPRLTRVFILRSLVGLRKSGKKAMVPAGAENLG